jgi:hypothetical protein
MTTTEALPVISWKPLGELLVERKLVTTDELEAALEQQSLTGERLGAILVNRRIVAGVLLTKLLAEQAGVELETQGGFGSGLFARIAHRNGPVPGALGSEPGPVQDNDASGPPALQLEPVAAQAYDPAYEVTALLAELQIERARVEQLQDELVRLRAKKPVKRAARGAPRRAASPALRNDLHPPGG